MVKQGTALRAFEVKWAVRRVSGRAFYDAYGVQVEKITAQNPFAADMLAG